MVFGMHKEVSKILLASMLGALIGLFYDNVMRIYSQSEIALAIGFFFGILFVLILIHMEFKN